MHSIEIRRMEEFQEHCFLHMCHFLCHAIYRILQHLQRTPYQNGSEFNLHREGEASCSDSMLQKLIPRYTFHLVFKQPHFWDNYIYLDRSDDPSIYKTYYQFGNSSETRTFVKDGNLIYKCFSKNLHLLQSEAKLETMEIKYKQLRKYFSGLVDLHKIELFEPGNSQVFIGIHSPFIPMNLVLDGHALKEGHSYKIEIRLEREENLLPPPHQTACRDNGPSEDGEKASAPNSYEMCLEMCEAESSRAIYNCYEGWTMIFTRRDFCRNQAISESDTTAERKREIEKRRVSCLHNCRPGCLKLHYTYKVKERKFEVFRLQIRPFAGAAEIKIHVRNEKVISNRHVPLYSSGALFSHIGGLLGYWLGISMFTSLDIIEKCFGAAVTLARRFKKHKAQKTLNSEEEFRKKMDSREKEGSQQKYLSQAQDESQQEGSPQQDGSQQQEGSSQQERSEQQEGSQQEGSKQQDGSQEQEGSSQQQDELQQQR